MTISFYIGVITFSGGQRLQLDPNSAIVLVGPNNSGKTSTLRELKKAASGARLGPVLREAQLQRRGSGEDLKIWLDNNVATIRSETERGKKQYSWLGATCNLDGYSNYEDQWKKERGVGDLAGILLTFLPVDKRLEYLEGTGRTLDKFLIARDGPQNPLHVILKKEEIESRFCEYFRKAFGTDLILGRGCGTDAPIYFGEKPAIEVNEDRCSVAYIERLSRLPLLSEQGHGMRSYSGTIVATLTSPSFVQLVDEPEAFLHPPQARLLGRFLVAEKPVHRQLVVATHSADVLRGALDSNNSNLSIIRLTREGATNYVKQLSVDKIREVWSDPILRFSNVFDGLFHENVVLCEADSDCRFYEAILDSIRSTDEPRPDVLFSSSGGKDRLPVIISSLVALGVNTEYKSRRRFRRAARRKHHSRNCAVVEGRME